MIGWLHRLFSNSVQAIQFPGVTQEHCLQVIVDHRHVADLWHRIRPGLAAALPKSWKDTSEGEQKWLFATALAHNLKPYGPGPAGVDLVE